MNYHIVAKMRLLGSVILCTPQSLHILAFFIKICFNIEKGVFEMGGSFEDEARLRIVRRLQYYAQCRMRHEVSSLAYVHFKYRVIVPQLQAALRNIDEGVYGVCEGCETSIPKQRLRILPGALRCVACQVDSR